MPTNKTLINNEVLHNAYQELHSMSNSPAPLIDKDNELIPLGLRTWPYNVSSWPILLNKKLSSQIENLSIRIPRLLQQIPKLYFNNNSQQIADYYFNSDLEKAERALAHIKDSDYCSRLDIVLTDFGCKVLEVNMGSSIGGTELQYFDPIVRLTHQKFFDSFNLKTSLFQNIFASYLFDKIRELKPEKQDINIFLSDFGVKDISARQIMKEFFKSLMVDTTGFEGIEVFVGSTSELTFKSRLYYEAQVMDAVLLLSAEKTMTTAMAKAHLNEEVFTPDHFGLDIFSSKKNLALLYRLALSRSFQEQDNELILGCIPWTYELSDIYIEYDSKNTNLVKLLLSNRSKFVIKPAHGFQSDGVVIGRIVSDEEWGHAINNALKEGNYIVQEYCESIGVYLYNSENRLVKFSAIWGSFAFSGKYGGVMARVSEANGSSGVVNGSNGLSVLVYDDC